MLLSNIQFKSEYSIFSIDKEMSEITKNKLHSLNFKAGAKIRLVAKDKFSMVIETSGTKIVLNKNVSDLVEVQKV